MNLSPGVRIGPYEIIAEIGAGGMGEVYRARDTLLNREVAIKILPDLLAHDTDRVARFTREAPAPGTGPVGLCRLSFLSPTSPSMVWSSGNLRYRLVITRAACAALG